MPSQSTPAQNTSAQDVLDFWFSENVEKHWFVRSDNLDEDIKQRFSALYEQAHSGALDAWGSELHSALALTSRLEGGVIMDVVTPDQARIAQDAGAVAVMAL